MILFTKIMIVLLLSYVVVECGRVLMAKLAMYRLRHIKYYTLESSDGHRYELACSTRKQAIEQSREMAYSGTAYEHTVGKPNKRKVAFVW